MTHTPNRRTPIAHRFAALFAATASGLLPLAPVHAQPAVEPAPSAQPALDPGTPVEVAAPPAASAESDEAAQLAAEMAAPPSETDVGLVSELESPSITAYGFADFSIHAQNEDSNPGAFAGEFPSFFIGNLNVYLRADLTKGWKSLAEVRFTYLPNGTLGPDLERQSTRTGDYAAFYAPAEWGGIMIQRAWVEYTAHPLLTVRAGHFLTPIGIWNVDHGTPTIIPAIRPFIIGSGAFPESQTGFEVYGSQYFGDTTIGYHLTLSNGRGNADKWADFDHNKALGGRLYATLNQLGTLTLGASTYFGKVTDAGLRFEPTKVPGPPYVPDIRLQYDEFVYAFDLLWKLGAFHLQAELITQYTVYTDEGRPEPGIPIFPQTLMPDARITGGYLLLAYELPWLPLTPFVQLDLNDYGSSTYFNGALDVGLVGGFGLNYRPVETVTLKAQYYHGRLQPPEPGLSKQDLRIFRFTTAWSF